jgi:hypothetical protein
VLLQATASFSDSFLIERGQIMKTQAFIDRNEIERIMRDAKANRASHLRRKTGKAAGAVRWSGVGVLVASCLAFFATHIGGTHTG